MVLLHQDVEAGNEQRRAGGSWLGRSACLGLVLRGIEGSGGDGDGAGDVEEDDSGSLWVAAVVEDECHLNECLGRELIGDGDSQHPGLLVPERVGERVGGQVSTELEKAVGTGAAREAGEMENYGCDGGASDGRGGGMKWALIREGNATHKKETCSPYPSPASLTYTYKHRQTFHRIQEAVRRAFGVRLGGCC